MPGGVEFRPVVDMMRSVGDNDEVARDAGGLEMGHEVGGAEIGNGFIGAALNEEEGRQAGLHVSER